MPFPAASVGLHLRPVESDITTRKILAYAAGLGASEPAFLDDAQLGGVRALPFQCVSPEWPVLLSMRHILDDTLLPDEARRGVHAIQDSVFHRPMRPGDKLITKGQLVSATPIRAGVLTVCRLETVARDTLEPVTTTWTSSIYRNVELAGEAATLLPLPVLAEADIQPLGLEAEAETVFIRKEMPHIYTECAEIWNPIHSEREVALAAGLPDVILHGTATWALAGLVILRRYGKSDVGALKRITGRFAGMVIPGDNITIRHQQDPSGVVRFEVRTSSGGLAISQGVAWL